MMIRIGLSFLTVFMIAAPCIAQQQGGGRGFRPRTGVELIDVTQVQDDLKATAEQKTKLSEIAAKIQEERTAARGGGGGASPEDRQKFVETRDSAIMASLSDAQKQKFKELKGKDFDLASLSPQRRGNN